MTQPRDANGKSREMEEGTVARSEQAPGRLDILYRVDQRPPVVLMFILGFQQFLTMFGATFSYPFLMEPHLCMSGDSVGMSELIGTVIFVAGLSTIIQTIFGVRLAIVQSCSYSFATPFIVLLSLPKWKCPPCVQESAGGGNVTCGSDAHADLWHDRLRELQGAVLVGSLFQMVVGFTGLVGFLLNFIGPITIAPTIAMIGLSLFDAASDKAQGQWWIALMTVALMAIFSQYMRNISIPFCGYRKGRGCVKFHLRFFALFPVLLAVLVSWFLCYIFTLTDVLPPEPEKWGYLARTDVRSDVITRAPWFRFPYPGQWGVPTVSIAGVLGALAAALSSMVESIGDYYACARLSGAPPPTKSAVNRGIGVEGITCMLAGAWGTGGGTTSYSENIGAIGITKVGSRAVIQTSGVLMVVIACIGKFNAIFVTIPTPIVGGLFLAMFGMVGAVGLSNLQYVDLNSSRNLFILGVSLFMGFSVPKWLFPRANAIDTGSSLADNVLSVLCSTSMFVAGFIAFFLDNTIPGTREERGLNKWRRQSGDSSETSEQPKVYDLPLIQPWLNRLSITRYLPFCPLFRGYSCRSRKERSPSPGGQSAAAPKGEVNQGFEHTLSTQL